MLKAGPKKRDKLAGGLTIIELLVAIAISMIPLSVIGFLIVTGSLNWVKTYNRANREIALQGQTAAVTFDRIGRKSERKDCTLYSANGADASVSTLDSGAVLIKGEALEFTYKPMTPPESPSGDSSGSSTVDKEYAQFYFDETQHQLKVDYGPYPHGSGGRTVNRTIVLAENVTDVEFSRTKICNIEQGTVRMVMKLRDSNDGKKITITTATLMRN